MNHCCHNPEGTHWEGEPADCCHQHRIDIERALNSVVVLPDEEDDLEQVQCHFCGGDGQFPSFSPVGSTALKAELLMCPACNGHGHVFRRRTSARLPR